MALKIFCRSANLARSLRVIFSLGIGTSHSYNTGVFKGIVSRDRVTENLLLLSQSGQIHCGSFSPWVSGPPTPTYNTGVFKGIVSRDRVTENLLSLSQYCQITAGHLLLGYRHLPLLQYRYFFKCIVSGDCVAENLLSLHVDNLAKSLRVIFTLEVGTSHSYNTVILKGKASGDRGWCWKSLSFSQPGEITAGHFHLGYRHLPLLQYRGF